ncbi:MFS transporter [Klenkia brasiliensis]|uniref:Major Facilitator Superfamily protein n=1 Tax=Klenkia brasiliensis TaxID=333142 RepID=A0A1G8AAF1_9ACTN|nr:MFS transporter [Klenkia brasiliensis]SDH17806.1 Major Facilitator Superfamily protein [Klenkia brasiliensis]
MTSSPRTLREAWIALTGLSAVFLVEMLDTSILTVALPTIGRDLHASAADLQWVTGAYSVVLGGLMIALGAVADRYGRRRTMLTGLVLLAVAAAATAGVASAGELVAVRVLMGVAAAMTTPGSMALAFRLFDDDRLRVRAITLISTVGLVGLAVGPTVGGLVLAVAPWQVLLLVNAPIALLALVCIGRGVAVDDPAERHGDPVDVLGALLGTAAIGLALVAPTLFVADGATATAPWAATVGAVLAAVVFVRRQRTARHPLLDLGLLARPLVSAGLAYKAAAGVATAGLGYLVTLQLQLDLGWTPAEAALGMLPQVLVLLAGGAVVPRFVDRVGMERAAWTSATAVVVGLAVYGALGRTGYPAVAVALALVAAGLRVVGVVAATNVMRGLPAGRTTIGAALTDTATQVAAAAGLAVAGTVLAAVLGDHLTGTAPGTAALGTAVTLGGLTLAGLAAALVAWGLLRSRTAGSGVPDGAGAPAADH